LHWGPLGVKLVHGVVPSLSGVSIDLPAFSNIGSGPVWDLEALEDSSWSSVEGNISDSLQDSVWMEVLGEDVVHDVRFLMELLHVEVFNSNTYLI